MENGSRFFPSAKTKTKIDQLWILPMGGGEAQKFTDAKGGVEDFAWAPDSKRIVLVVRSDRV